MLDMLETAAASGRRSRAWGMTAFRGFNVGLLYVYLFLAASNSDVTGAWAQSPDTTSPIQLIPRTKEERERKYQAEHRIVLAVRVTDSLGKPVTGLKADDFSLLDNQKAQKIARFREVDGKTFTVKTHVIIVLDGINDDASSFGRLTKGLDQFLSEDTGPLPFPLSLAFVSSAGVSRTQASTDRAAIALRLGHLARLPRDQDCEQPNLNVYEGVGTRMLPTEKEKVECKFSHFSESIKALRSLLGEKQNSRVRDRTILIWTGPGWPRAVLRRGNYPDLLVELNTNLRQAQVTLDAVSWGVFDPGEGMMTATGKVPQTPENIAAEEMRLQVLARQNGGQAIVKARNIADAILKCMEDANDFYILSFDSTPAATANEFHSIDLKVNRPGVAVRVSGRYYAQP
jgi:VWFA-related protein